MKRAIHFDGEPVTILQSGRLGDLWYCVPLAQALQAAGSEVRVVHRPEFAGAFEFFPGIIAEPAGPQTAHDSRLRHAIDEALWQRRELRRLQRENCRIVWNQIFPHRWLAALRAGRPYPEFWYRDFPGIDFRSAKSTFPTSEEPVLLFFRRSFSFRSGMGGAFDDWTRAIVRRVANVTKCEVLAIATAGEPNDAEFPTWRGSPGDYQRLIARCSIVAGVTTSGHVLAQLLGKRVIALYPRKVRTLDRIGAETLALDFPARLPDDDTLRQLLVRR